MLWLRETHGKTHNKNTRYIQRRYGDLSRTRKHNKIIVVGCRMGANSKNSVSEHSFFLL
jgi:hypothetical protein